MKRQTLILSALMLTPLLQAQKKDFSYSFYGFIRNDMFYNSRANNAAVEGTFYLYPMDKKLDSNGEDLNAQSNTGFYSFTTRLGINIKGPMIGSAQTSGKIETDFGGFSSSCTLLRIRQAYFKLDWQNSSLTIGQTWHPLAGSVTPSLLCISQGAPFQPFNREPQFRYQYNLKGIELTAAALWQLQYISNGPNGKSLDYMKNNCLPEFYVGADILSIKDWRLGAGVHTISLKPRLASEWEGKTYKVNEHIRAFSYEAHLKYSHKDFTFAAKSLLASCLDYTSMLSGYGISSINKQNGKQKYVPFRHSTSWIDLTYGSKWKSGLFLGFTKNLGTNHSLASSTTYGNSLNIDKLCMCVFSFSYNLPHWSTGIEFTPTKVWYGENNLENGKVINTHAVTNQRIALTALYIF
ncbi:MAG: hypothetical protein PHG06_02280 [Parabacteroides sp.]|nr:hypothetical protein [Parabacteroides sp.]